MKTKEEILSENFYKEYSHIKNEIEDDQQALFNYEELSSFVMPAMEEYATEKSYFSMIIVYDMIKAKIKKYTAIRDSQQKLLDIYKEKYKNVADSMKIEIESCDKFIKDLEEIKNKIVEINNNK